MRSTLAYAFMDLNIDLLYTSPIKANQYLLL